jgi:Protein of unknown function (DUF2568)
VDDLVKDRPERPRVDEVVVEQLDQRKGIHATPGTGRSSGRRGARRALTLTRRCDASGNDAGVPSMKAANLALKFLVELGAIAAFAYWGANAAGGMLSVLLAILAPVVVILAWGVFAAPKSGRRLPAVARVPFELFVFAGAVVALLAAGSTVGAVLFGALVVVNAALLTVFRQWDR